jgi:two-component system, LytTR family, sensor histidine kinase LytS
VGGFLAAPAAISTVAVGFAAGIVYKLVRDRMVTIPVTALFAALAECFLMALTLLMARPFSNALEAVKLDVISMIVSNGIGAGIIAAVVRNLVRENHGEVVEYRTKY